MLRDQKRGGLSVRNTAMVRREAEAEERSLLQDALRGGALGTAGFLCAGGLLLSAGALLASFSKDPTALIAPLALAALLLSAFLGGWITSRRVGESPLLCGVIEGGMITLCTIALALILRPLPSSALLFWQSALLHGATVFFSILGAMAGGVKRKRTTKRRFGC